VRKKAKTPIEQFLALSDAKKDAQVAEFENGADLSQFRPLTPAERKLWQKATRRMGRPKIGQGSKMIPVSIELGLLKQVDAFAKAHKLKRSQAIAKGLQLLMRAGQIRQ
jgi:hypothetical protein